MVAAITAANLATLITALATLVTAVGAIVLGVLNRTRLGQVHEAVNGIGERREARNTQLEHAMVAGGVAIPPPAPAEAAEV
jgi:hypothetical protein